MAHPFERLLEKQIPNSRGDENAVLGEAERLMEQGYTPKEIYGVLLKLKQSLISPADEAIVAYALEEFSQYVDLDDTVE